MKNTKDLTLISIMTAIIFVMLAIPGLGFIPVGTLNATIVHIPVIILAIVKGPKLGAILGGIFGIASMINALLRPIPTSFIFINPIIAVVPRILIGLLTGYIAKAFTDRKLKYNLQNAIPAAIGSLINTVGVLGLIYIIYGQDYLSATGRVGQSAFLVIGYLAITNGLIEMLLSILIATPISSTLLSIEKRGKK